MEAVFLWYGGALQPKSKTAVPAIRPVAGPSQAGHAVLLSSLP